MRADGGIAAADPRQAAAAAEYAEAAGYAGAWTVETRYDPFFAVQAAAQHTSSQTRIDGVE